MLGIKEEENRKKQICGKEENERKKNNKEDRKEINGRKEKVRKEEKMEKGKKQEGNKRGRKKETERGILAGEQSIKSFLENMNKKENDVVKTPKRKRKENEEIVIFGQEETPGKKRKIMLEKHQTDRNLLIEGGKVKRMLDRFEGGKGMIRKGIQKNSLEGRISDLRNGKGNSSELQSEKVQKQKEGINTNFNVINSEILLGSYNDENGALRNPKRGQKNGLFGAENNELVQSVHNRGGIIVKNADRSVLANEKKDTDEFSVGPIRNDSSIQLGTGHRRDKM